MITPLPRTDLRPIPESQMNNSSGTPYGTWTNDRTTRVPSAPRPLDEEKSLVVPAVYSTPAGKTLDDGGWRAARR